MIMRLKSAMATGTLYITDLINSFLFQLHDLTPIICAVCVRAVKLLGVGQWVVLLVAMTTKGKSNPAYN